MTCPICNHPGSADAESCAYQYRHPKPSPLATGSASVFAPLEARLSETAKLALAAYFMGFAVGDPTMTVRELRTYIRRIFGEDADRELEQHLADRRAAVLPSPNPKISQPEKNHEYT